MKVRNFMENVPDVKEESITDYLVWKWRNFDPRFKYINISTFTRHVENTVTGADFELELWLVHRRFHFPLIFQAKKLAKPNDSYVAKLNYPAGSQGQLSRLLNYAKAYNKLPFYAFYSIPDSNTRTMCGLVPTSHTSIFVADAHTVKSFADGKHGKRVSKNKLLQATNPFHCMFCCPLTLDYPFSGYFLTYFPALNQAIEPRDNEALPEYAKLLLSGQIFDLSESELLSLINQNELRTFRAVGVYDMRSLEDETNKSTN